MADGTPPMSVVAERLRAGVAARQAELAKPAAEKAPPAHPAPSPSSPVRRRASWNLPPLPEDGDETAEEVAREALELLEAALNDGAVQRDSVRLVLGCHAALVRLDRARATEERALLAELKAVLAGAREPMPREEREAWKADFLAETRAAMDRLETVHRDGAAQGAVALRDEAGRLYRAIDNAAAWRACGLIAGSLVLGVLLGGVSVWSLCH